MKDVDLAPHHDVQLIDYKPEPLTMLHDSRLAEVVKQRDELLEVLQLCEGNISSLLAANHPMVFGKWLDVVRAAIAKAGDAT